MLDVIRNSLKKTRIDPLLIEKAANSIYLACIQTSKPFEVIDGRIIWFDGGWHEYVPPYTLVWQWATQDFAVWYHFKTHSTKVAQCTQGYLENAPNRHQAVSMLIATAFKVVKHGRN